MRQSNSSYIYLLLTILFWSATPAVAKLALAELDNLQLLFYTSIVGVISLFLVVVLQKKIGQIKEFKKTDYFKILGMGFLGIFLYYVFLFGSFAIAPAGQANVVNYLWPVFIILFSIPILKEKFNYKTILAVLISFIGALIVFTRGEFSSFSNEYTFGYLLAALGAVCYGLFSVLGKKLHYEKFTSMLFYYIFATILIIPTTLIFSKCQMLATTTSGTIHWWHARLRARVARSFKQKQRVSFAELKHTFACLSSGHKNPCPHFFHL